MDIRDTGPLQSLPGKLIEIRQIAAFDASDKSRIGRRIVGDKGLVHLGTDFERGSPNRGPKPRHQMPRRHRHGSDGCFQNTSSQPTPAGMRGGDDATGTVAEENRQAIGRHHGTDATRLT